MPSSNHNALIKSSKSRHVKAIRRSRSKQDILYQKWIVWTAQSSIQVIAHEYALRKTKEQWKRLYNEVLQRRQIVLVNLTRLYLVDTQQDVFRLKELALWGIEKDYLQPSWKSANNRQKLYLWWMMEGHYINKVDNQKAYVLTQRAKLLLSTYERYLRHYIQPSQIAQ